MTAERVVLKEIEDREGALERAARLLAEGALVVFPTETVYGLAANAEDESAVNRLYQAKGRPLRKPLTIHLADAVEAERYVGRQHGAARRLMERGWPGPITLVLPRLPSAPGTAGTGREETVGLRLPDHAVAREVVRRSGVPVVATSANISGKAPPTTAEEVLYNVGDSAALVLDDGPTRFGRASTVVRLINGRPEVLREGVVSRRGVLEMAAVRVLFVCSGNTCRSPMAEAIARRLLTGRLRVPDGKLLEAGFEVRSGGIGAIDGAGASEMAISTMSEMGYDLTGHTTRPISASDLIRFDLIFTMTDAQREMVSAMWPRKANRVLRLDPDQDIPDPVGGSAERFRTCAQQIEKAIKKRLEMILAAAQE